MSIVCLSMVATSIAFYIMESTQSPQLSAQSVHFAWTFGLYLNLPPVYIILSIEFFVALLWMLFSIMLMTGVAQNKPNFVLCYFSFGIIVTIICQLSALLVLLQKSWILSLVLCTSSLLHIHVLVVVHTVYEFMSRSEDFGFHQHEDIESLLADCFNGDASKV